MTTPLIPMTPDEIDALVRLYLELDAKRAELADACDAIKAKLRAELDIGTHTTSTGVKITLTPNRRFDPNLAEDIIPPNLKLACVTTIIDPKKARNELSGSLYQQCMRDVGEPRITIQ